MSICRKAKASDSVRINEIYNQAITQGLQTGDQQIWTLQHTIDWLHAHQSPYGVLVMVDENDYVVGYGYLSPYRQGKQAFATTAEISFYMDAQFQGKGLGQALIKCLEQSAFDNGMNQLLAFVIADNQRSRRLLEKHGYEAWGRLPEVGRLGKHSFDHCIYGKMLHKGLFEGC